MVLDIVIDIGIILLLVASIVLCVAVIAILLKLSPPLLRFVRHLEKAAGDTAAVSGEVTDKIAEAARNATVTSEHAVAASRHLEKITKDVAAVSEDVTNDIAKTARNSTVASENAVEASRNIVGATEDAARAAAAVATIARLDIRAFLTQIAAGNIGSVKQLAELAVRLLPQGVSRVGSFFGRSGG